MPSVVAGTGVLDLRRWSARLRVAACEKEPAIARPFITCKAVLGRAGGGGRALAGTLPVFTTCC